MWFSAVVSAISSVDVEISPAERSSVAVSVVALSLLYHPQPVTTARCERPTHTLAGWGVLLVILFKPLLLQFLLSCPHWKKSSLHLFKIAAGDVLLTPCTQGGSPPLLRKQLQIHSPRTFFSPVLCGHRLCGRHPQVPSAQHFVAPPRITPPS